MKPITQFAIFKNDNATGNQPQYRMVAKDEQGKSLTLASLWLKEHNGQKYYSGQMKEEFTKDDGTKYEGYVIIPMSEYKRLATGQSEGNNDMINPDDVDF